MPGPRWELRCSRGPSRPSPPWVRASSRHIGAHWLPDARAHLLPSVLHSESASPPGDERKVETPLQAEWQQREAAICLWLHKAREEVPVPHEQTALLGAGVV